MISEKEKTKFLECLEENPMVSRACTKLGIHKSTVYRWRKNKVFARRMDRAIEIGRSKLNDFVESRLIEKCRDDVKAQTYYLGNNHPNYMSPQKKTELEITPKPITKNVIQFVDFKEDKKPPQENQNKTKEPILLPAPEDQNEILGS